jgi:hypothetical protein
MAVHTLRDIVSGAVAETGCWEPLIMHRVLDHFRGRQNALFIDIGGNIGAFTTTMAANGHQVISIEPFRLNVPILMATVCRNRFDSHTSVYKVCTMQPIYPSDFLYVS